MDLTSDVKDKAKKEKKDKEKKEKKDKKEASPPAAAVDVDETQYPAVVKGDGGTKYVRGQHEGMICYTLQVAPNHAPHRWKAKWDTNKGRLFFTCLADKTRKVWKLPAVDVAALDPSVLESSSPSKEKKDKKEKKEKKEKKSKKAAGKSTEDDGDGDSDEEQDAGDAAAEPTPNAAATPLAARPVPAATSLESPESPEDEREKPQPVAEVEAIESPEKQRLRKRLTEFYTEFAPTEIHKIDKVMEQNSDEEALFVELRRKYNAETPAVVQPEISAEAPEEPIERQQLRKKLEAFYSEHSPNEMHKVDAAMRMKVSEAELWAALRKKYGVAAEAPPKPPSPPPQPVAAETYDDDEFEVVGAPSPPMGPGVMTEIGGEDEDPQLRIEVIFGIYAKFSPSDTYTPNFLAENEEMTLEEIIHELKMKFDIEEDDEVLDPWRKAKGVALPDREAKRPITFNPHSAFAEEQFEEMRHESESPQKQRLRQRLTEFYTQYAPTEIHKVEKALEMNIDEEELFAKLRQKYILTSESNETSNPGCESPDKQRLRQRLTEFYTQHAPMELHKVDMAMQMNVDEEVLFAKLRQKYFIEEPSDRKDFNDPQFASPDPNSSMARSETSDVARSESSSTFKSKRRGLDRLADLGYSAEDIANFRAHHFGREPSETSSNDGSDVSAPRWPTAKQDAQWADDFSRMKEQQDSFHEREAAIAQQEQERKRAQQAQAAEQQRIAEAQRREREEAERRRIQEEARQRDAKEAEARELARIREEQERVEAELLRKKQDDERAMKSLVNDAIRRKQEQAAAGALVDDLVIPLSVEELEERGAIQREEAGQRTRFVPPRPPTGSQAPVTSNVAEENGSSKGDSRGHTEPQKGGAENKSESHDLSSRGPTIFTSSTDSRANLPQESDALRQERFAIAAMKLETQAVDEMMLACASYSFDMMNLYSQFAKTAPISHSPSPAADRYVPGKYRDASVEVTSSLVAADPPNRRGQETPTNSDDWHALQERQRAIAVLSGELGDSPEGNAKGHAPATGRNEKPQPMLQSQDAKPNVNSESTQNEAPSSQPSATPAARSTPDMLMLAFQRRGKLLTPKAPMPPPSTEQSLSIEPQRSPAPSRQNGTSAATPQQPSRGVQQTPQHEQRTPAQQPQRQHASTPTSTPHAGASRTPIVRREPNKQAFLQWDPKRSGPCALTENGTVALAERSEAYFEGTPLRGSQSLYTIGTIGIAKGELVFEVVVDQNPLHRSQCFCVGVASKYFRGPSGKKCPAYLFRSDGYILPVSDGTSAVTYSRPVKSGARVTVHLDMNRWELSFYVDGEPRGVAFRFTPIPDPEPLFPVVVLSGDGDTVSLMAPSAEALPEHVSPARHRQRNTPPPEPPLMPPNPQQSPVPRTREDELL